MTAPPATDAMTARLAEDVPRYPGLPDGSWVEVDGLRTWLCRCGAGAPVVFVYGGNFASPHSASGAHAWGPAVQRLSRPAAGPGGHPGFETIVYDKPGQGWTDRPRRHADYSMTAVVRHLIALVERLGVGPVHLVGHSRGGYVVTRTALLRQDLVRSVTIVASGTLSPGISTNEVALGNPPFAPSRESVRWVYEGYFHDPANVTDEFVDASWSIVRSENYQASVAEARAHALNDRHFLPELERDKRETLTWIEEGRLQRPVQIVWGRNDVTASLTKGLLMFDTIRRTQRRTGFAVVDSSGHFPYREQPDWFAGVVGGFLQEVDTHAW